MRHRLRHRAFTIIEMLTVLGILMLLLALLLPALTAVRKQGVMTDSMNNLKQIASWMTLYSQDNRDTIVPSRFNYAASSYPGKVRSVWTDVPGSLLGRYQGTWTDILWTVYEVGSVPEAVSVAGIGHDYRYDSPDSKFYELVNNDLRNPFRSAASNTRNALSAAVQLPVPFGAGAQERSDPGYFAANNFFNADESSVTRKGWFTNSQIRRPAQSLYAIDSFWGETIEVNLPTDAGDLELDTGPDCAPWDFRIPPDVAVASRTGQVDFRYVGDNALILFLDSHVGPEGRFRTLNELETTRKVRVRNLVSDTKPAPPCP